MTPLDGSTYYRGEARSVADVAFGTVIDARPVILAGTGKPGSPNPDTQQGSFLGFLLGGFLGSKLGGGAGQVLATAVGAGIGASAGSHAGQALSQRPGVELTIRRAAGGHMVVVQQAEEDVEFSAGDAVRITTTHQGVVRVSHAG